MEAETARLDEIVRAAAHFLRRFLFAVVTQTHPHAAAQSLAAERDGLVVAQSIRVADDVRAGLVNAEHHQRPLFFRERIIREEAADELPHRREIARVAAELESLFLHALIQNLNKLRPVFKPQAELTSTIFGGATLENGPAPNKKRWTAVESLVQFRAWESF